MRVLIVAHGVPDQSLLGGPGRVAAAHARALSERGHEVRVLTSNLVVKGRAADPTFDLLGSNIDVDWVHAHTLRWWPGTVGPIFGLTSKAVRGAVRGVDIVHCHEWPHTLIQRARRTARQAGVPTVIQPHGSIQRRSGLNRMLHLTADKLHPLRVDDVVIVGGEQEELEVRRIVHDVPSLHRLVNPMPPSQLSQDAPEVVARRRSWRLPAGGRAVLYAHRLVPNKGLDLMIEALVHLPSDNYLIVVGDDSVFPAFVQGCRQLAHSLGLEKRVRFCGAVTRMEIDEVIMAADLFVLPARRDTFPLMVLHALACGRPVVLTDTCQSIDELEGAVAIAPAIPEALAGAIVRIDDVEALRLVTEGENLLRERFSPESVALHLEELYHDVVIRSSPRA